MIYIHHLHICFILICSTCTYILHDVHFKTFSRIKQTSVSNHSHLATGGSSKEETVHRHASLPSTSMQGNLNASAVVEASQIPGNDNCICILLIDYISYINQIYIDIVGKDVLKHN